MKQGLTTQQADGLLSAANKQANNVMYDVKLAMGFLQDQVGFWYYRNLSTFSATPVTKILRESCGVEK